MRIRIRKRIFLWLLWLYFAGMLHLFGNNIGTFVIMFASAVIPAVFAAITAIASGDMDAEFELQSESEKSEEIRSVLYFRNNNKLIMSRAACRVICENFLTGELLAHTIYFMIENECERKAVFEILSNYCGNLRVSVDDFYVTDIFGLLSKKIDIPAEKSVLIMPQSFDTEIHMSDVSGDDTESGEYSSAKPGWDSGETLAVREYAPGDPIKSIHWKISQKSDNLMVREFGLPVNNQLLLLFDAFFTDMKFFNNFEEWHLFFENHKILDAMAEVFMSVSLSLARSEIPHDIGWFNMHSKEIETRTISGESDVNNAVREFLLSFNLSEYDKDREVLQYIKNSGYAHIVVISSDKSMNSVEFYGKGRITVLCSYGSEYDGATYSCLSNGVYLYTFAVGNYKDELSVLEL